MNPSPRLHGVFVTPQTDGFLAMHNIECAFWQSRMTTAGHRAELPNLVSLHDLARKIRAATNPVTITTTHPEFSANLAAYFPGIPARALTPCGSFDTAMDRSDVATAPVSGRRLHPGNGYRCVVEVRCDANGEAEACFTPSYTGPNFGGWPNP